MNERIKKLAAEIKSDIENNGEWTGHTGWLPETENPADMQYVNVRYAKIVDSYVVTWGEERYERYIETIEKAAEFAASLMDGGNGLSDTGKTDNAESLEDYIEKNAPKARRQYRRKAVKPVEREAKADEPAGGDEWKKEAWKRIDEVLVDMCSIIRVNSNNARINRERREREKAEGVAGWRGWRR